MIGTFELSFPYSINFSCTSVATSCVDKVFMYLTNKYYAVEPALCMGIEIQVTLCWWKNEWHGDYIHLFTCAHKPTCSQ